MTYFAFQQSLCFLVFVPDVFQYSFKSYLRPQSQQGLSQFPYARAFLFRFQGLHILTYLLLLLLLLLLLCFVFFLKIFIRSIPSFTQQPQVCESGEVNFEVYCIYLVLNIHIVKMNRLISK